MITRNPTTPLFHSARPSPHRLHFVALRGRGGAGAPARPSRHWRLGELLDEDVRENELSLREGFRLLSSYPVCECAGDRCGEHRVWIITEADRSATMILLPEDY